MDEFIEKVVSRDRTRRFVLVDTDATCLVTIRRPCIRPSIRPLGLAFSLTLALVAAWAPSAQAQPLQPGFTESVVFSGMTEPTDVAFAPDGRVFISEKSGLIKVFSSLSATTPTIAADLRTEVYNFWDRGLLSIALDPASSRSGPTSTRSTLATPRSAGWRRNGGSPGPNPIPAPPRPAQPRKAA